MTVDGIEVRPIPGYEGLYSVSADGRVYSHPKFARRRGGPRVDARVMPKSAQHSFRPTNQREEENCNVFELTDETVKLLSFNPRPEFHGEDRKPAADLKVEAALPNDMLALFHPTLKSSLYHYDDQIAGDLVDVAKKDEDKTYAPHVRFPKLGPLKWDGELVGATVRIDYGVRSALVLNECNINGFVLEPQNGGTVTTTFRIQGHPGEKESGKLCTLIGSEITITVEPPKVQPTPADDSGKGGDGNDGPQTPGQKADSFFKEKVD